MLTDYSAIKLIAFFLSEFAPHIFGATIVLLLLLAMMLKVANSKPESLEKILKWFIRM